MSSALITPHGLTNQQFLALLLIRENVGLSQVELTAELDSDQNTVSAMVRRLAASGFVTRESQPTDRRAIRLVATQAGVACVDQALPDVDRLSLKLVAITPVEQEKTIMHWLETVANLHEV